MRVRVRVCMRVRVRVRVRVHVRVRVRVRVCVCESVHFVVWLRRAVSNPGGAACDGRASVWCGYTRVLLHADPPCGVPAC